MYRSNAQIDKTLLFKGMEIKNWKELCKLQNWKVGSKTRITQEKTLNQVCKWNKQGHKIFIDEVFGEIIPKEDKRRKGGVAPCDDIYDKFHVPKEYEESMIIYRIILDNEIYIGSTIKPKYRYYQHLCNTNGKTKETCDMLSRGAVFELVHVFDEDEELMRMCESELIKLYSSDSRFICKNTKLAYKEKNENKKVKLEIDFKDLEFLIDLLIENKIDYKIK